MLEILIHYMVGMTITLVTAITLVKHEPKQTNFTIRRSAK